MPVIRPATLNDLDRLADLWIAFMRDHRRYAREVRTTRHNRAVVRDHLAGLVPHGQVLVVDDGEVQGFVAVVVDLPKLDVLFASATISDLYVAPGLRGQGWGKRLVDSAVAMVRERGLHAVRITVRSGNTVARSLYRQAGFRPLQETLILPLDADFVQFGPDAPEE
jgi:ribosomal protein S18 acetylase RimI-like enzyme